MKKEIKYLYLLENSNTNERYVDCAKFNDFNVNNDTYKSDNVLKQIFMFNGKENYIKQVLTILTDEDSIEENILKYCNLLDAKFLYGVTEEIEFILPKKKVVCLNNMNIYKSVLAVKKVKGVISSELYKALEKNIKEPIILGEDVSGAKLFWMYFDEFSKREDLYTRLQRTDYINKASLEVLEKSKSTLNRKSIKIICLNDMKIYNSIKEASKKFNANIGNALNHGVYSRRACGVDKNGNLNQWMFHAEYLEKVKNGENVKYNPDFKPRDNKLGRKIICLNNNKTYDTIQKAIDDTNSNVRAALRGCIGVKTCGLDENGVVYQWMYHDEYLEKISNGEKIGFNPDLKPGHEELVRRSKTDGKKVICLNDGAIYNSVKKAEKERGVNIGASLKGGYFGYKSCGVDENGAINQWMYYDEYLEKLNNGEDVSYNPNLKARKKSISVKCIETGEIFKSIRSASIKTGVATHNITASCVTGEQVKAIRDSGYDQELTTWEYVDAL
jgi:hypothetical protein